MAVSHSACSIFSDAKKLELELKEDVSYKIGSSPSKQGKSGEVITLDGTPVLVEAPAKVSMYIIPSPEAAGRYELNLSNSRDISAPIIRSEALSITNLVIEKIIDIQVKLAKKQPREALKIIDSLKNTQPGLSYLGFLEASCFYILGDKKKAKEALTIALDAHPNDEKGKKLLKILNK